MTHARIINQSFGFLTPGEIARGGVRRVSSAPRPGVALRFDRGRAAQGAMKVFSDVSGMGDAGPSDATKIQAMQQFARTARAQAIGGNFDAAQASYASAESLFLELGSPPAYSDDLELARQAAFGVETVDAAGRTTSQALAADAAELQAGRVNARPQSVVGSFFGSLKSDARAAASSLENLGPGGVAEGLADRLLKPAGYVIGGYLLGKILRIW